MTTAILPQDLNSKTSRKSMEDIHLFRYHAPVSSIRNRITLTQNLFSFVLEGFKSVTHLDKNIHIGNSEFLLLSSGNCLMTEKNGSDRNLFSSVMMFFDNQVLVDFFLKYASLIASHQKFIKDEQGILVFQQDEFVKNFASSIGLLIADNRTPSREIKRLKFEEIMLYLLDNYPRMILNLRSRWESPEDSEIRKLVESNFESNITVEELAFLCNTSLSTFKRRFSKIYGSSPNKWMLTKRMEVAARMLEHQNEKPSTVYYKLGYDNLSSFIESFKRVYGTTPKAYQNKKLNV